MAQNSPKATRSRMAVKDAETDPLQAALRELRQMREERDRQQARFDALLREKDERLRCLEQRISSHQSSDQLSPSDFRDRASGDTPNNFQACASTARSATNASATINAINASDAINASEVTADFRTKTGLKLKPDTYDGKIPLRKFLSQFLLIAVANKWDDKTKTIFLAANLRGKARTVLENVENFEELTFGELKSKLELLFGDGNLTQNYYSLFTNRKQKYGEDFASFGTELERLSRFAYPECPYEVRDKIACAQFVSALSDNFVKRTLQLEGVTSLNLAIERGKAIEIIRDENCDNHARTKEFDSKGKAQANNSSSKECWSCGKTGHLRFQCPDAKGD